MTSVQTTELQVVVDPPVSPTFQTSGVITGTIGRGTASAPPTAPPIVASVSPQTGRQGQTLDVVITGINTQFSTVGTLTQATFGPGITVSSATPQDDTHLLVRLAIAGNANPGPRLVAVSTGRSEALLANAFSVVSGTGTITGRLLNAQGQPIANAQVCLQQTTICVTTGSDGSFTFGDVPIDARRVVVSAPGYETAILPFKLIANGSASLGDVALAISDVPPPPPLPNSPPVAPRVAAALGRGATEFAPGGNPEQFKKLIRDAIIAVGGKELGVMDESGQQLNPLMAGAGYASFTNLAVEELANDMIAGDTISLAELFKIFMGSLKFPAGVELPTLQQLIAGFQDSVNQAWADTSRPDAPHADSPLQPGTRHFGDAAGDQLRHALQSAAEEPARGELHGLRHEVSESADDRGADEHRADDRERGREGAGAHRRQQPERQLRRGADADHGAVGTVPICPMTRRRAVRRR